MRVLKFGGTSVGDPDAIERLAGIVQRETAADGAAAARDGSRHGVAVVASALAGATDCLLGIADHAQAGEAAPALDLVASLRARHMSVARAVADPERAEELCEEIHAQFERLGAVVRSLAVLREVAPRSLDAVAAIGEILSSRIVAAALATRGFPAEWVDPRGLIVTDNSFTIAVPLMSETFARLTEVLDPLLAAGHVPVTGGFVGATPDGITTTLGRGGSDYSASIVGAGIAADEIQIWTDVDGMLTADPRVYAAPQLVPQLSFDEAAELAYFGAKVLHPKTIHPALARAIPVRILNSRNPEAAGTRITAVPAGPRGPVAAFACKRQVTVIDVTSGRMLEAHGFLRRLFQVFERHQTSVDVVTTSEVSVSMTVDDVRHLEAIVEDLSDFAEVVTEDRLALLGIVGDNLHADPGTFARIVGALGRVPLKLVSQAASRRNVTIVLPEAELAGALARLHEVFFGEAAAAGDASPPPLRAAGAASV
jgi:aspartate kinase